MKLFELEDRPVVVADPNTAWVFSGDTWRAASVRLARTALLDGYWMGFDEFAAMFPRAAASLLAQDFMTAQK